MKTAKFRAIMVVFMVGCLVAIIPFQRVGAQDTPIPFWEGDIGIETRTLPISGYEADVYFPNPDVSPADDAFPIVAFLQGASVDKIFYSGFCTELARYGFVVVIPNRIPLPPSFPPSFPTPFPDEFLILDVLALMIAEDNNPFSPLSGTVDTDRMGLAGHSAGGAAGLFAIGLSCQPPFCFPPGLPFPLPDAVRGGAFYGTNSFDSSTGEFIPVNTNGIPVALIQGTRDGISTQAEAEATIADITGPSELILILDEESGANHYGITDEDFIPPPFPPDLPQNIDQEDSIKLIAQATGEFLLKALSDISVDKTCLVIPPPAGPFECDDKVDALKMVWNGPATLESVTAYRGDVGSETLPADISTEEIGDVNRQVVTVAGYQPSTNDVQWEWVSNNDSGVSQFHLSCSDDEMDGETDDSAYVQDCGRPQGNGKSNEDDKYDNFWLLDGMATDKGFVLDCTPSPIMPSDQCTFEATPVPGCKTDPEVNDLTSITFRYTGEDCSVSDNDQGEIGDKWNCVGVPGGDNVSITVIKDAGKTSSDKASVNVGDTFTLSDDFSSESIVAVGGQTLTFHTSCSQPLAVGDVFGSLEVVGINGLSPGREITYFYEVTNNGGTAVNVTSVFDDQLGELLADPKELASNESFTLYETAFISETTTNKVTVLANLFALDIPSGVAMDEVTVTVVQPTCEAAIVFDKLEDDKIKWKITNTGKIVATLETLSVDFPPEYGFIKEVKLDGGIWKKDDSDDYPNGLPSGITIGSDTGWTNPDVGKRQLDPDETRTLEVVFTQKAKGAGWVDIDSAGTATFEEGCAVELIKPSGCEIGKPTALVFQYTGDDCVDGNDQASDKWSCSGDPSGADPVQVVLTKDADKFNVSPSTVSIGDVLRNP